VTFYQDDDGNKRTGFAHASTSRDFFFFLLISYEQFGWRRIIVDLLKDDAF